MSKARVGATLMVISLAAFALNCGVAATAPGIRLDVGSNPDPGTPSNPSASSDKFAYRQLDSHWSGYVLLPPAYSICELASRTDRKDPGSSSRELVRLR